MFNINSGKSIEQELIFIHQTKRIGVIIIRLVTRNDIQHREWQCSESFSTKYIIIKSSNRRNLRVIGYSDKNFVILITTIEDARKAMRVSYINNWIITTKACSVKSILEEFFEICES